MRKLIKKILYNAYVRVTTHFGKSLFRQFFLKRRHNAVFRVLTPFDMARLPVFRAITLFILFFSSLNNIYRISYVHYTNRSTIFFFNGWVQNRHLMSGKYFCSYFQYNVRLKHIVIKKQTPLTLILQKQVKCLQYKWKMIRNKLIN